VLWFKRATGQLAETLQAEAVRQTIVLQDWLAERLGKAFWSGFATSGYADAAVAPMVHRSILYGMEPPPGSPLAKWHERLREQPSVAVTFAEFEASAARMADTVAAFGNGRKLREYRDHRLEWMVKSGGIEVVLTGLRDADIRFPWPNPR
jgi:hypothetical protein